MLQLCISAGHVNLCLPSACPLLALSLPSRCPLVALTLSIALPLIERRMPHLHVFWPQELDNSFLIIWEDYDGLPWRHVSSSELRAFLLARVADGYAFPLNPKWLLCDPGWYEIYTALAASAAAQDALECWLPEESGLRERIAAVHATHPDGFSWEGGEGKDVGSAAQHDAHVAELALKRYIALKKAKIKLRVVLCWMRIGREATALRRSREAVERSADASPLTEATGDELLSRLTMQLSQRLEQERTATEDRLARAAERFKEPELPEEGDAFAWAASTPVIGPVIGFLSGRAPPLPRPIGDSSPVD